MSTTTNLSQLKINKMTKAQYQALENPSDTELYLTPDESLTSDDVDSTITSTSENPVQSKAIYNALANKTLVVFRDWSS